MPLTTRTSFEYACKPESFDLSGSLRGLSPLGAAGGQQTVAGLLQETSEYLAAEQPEVSRGQ
jgi:hypothetical protein